MRFKGTFGTVSFSAVLALAGAGCLDPANDVDAENLEERTHALVEKTLNCGDVGFFPTYTFWGLTKVHLGHLGPAGTTLKVNWEAGLSGAHDVDVNYGTPTNFEGRWAGATLDIRFLGYVDSSGAYIPCQSGNSGGAPQLLAKTY